MTEEEAWTLVLLIGAFGWSNSLTKALDELGG